MAHFFLARHKQDDAVYAYQIKQATSLIIHRHFPVLKGSLTSAV